MTPARILIAAACALACLALAAPRQEALAQTLSLPWPDPLLDSAPQGEPVTFASTSPYALADVGKGPERDPPQAAQGRLFMPASASAAAPVPAVIFLHGAGGISQARELTYARQLAARGVAALAIDVFGARRERASRFIDRIMEITEAMYLADAYAGLAMLAERSDIDAGRVALIGFSYGAMAATYAAYRQVADSYAPAGPRFAAHVAFYGPCIAQFRDSTTTGAPLLMLYGERDAIVDPERCARTAGELEDGGSTVRITAFPNGAHQWDGRTGERMIGRNIAACDFIVTADGSVSHRILPLSMSSPLNRKIMLGLCADDEGYLMGRDDAVRAEANKELADFLRAAFDR